MALRIVDLDPRTDARWDAYVAAHPDGTVYHHSAWLRVLAAEYPRPTVALAAVDDDDRVRGVLPLVRTRGMPLLGRRSASLGPRLSSLPRTPVAGPLGDDAAAVRALVAAAVERTPPGTQLQLKLDGPRLEGIELPVAGRPWRASYVVPLPERVEDLRLGANSRARSSLRGHVNRARRAGIALRDAASAEDVRAWHAVYLATMRDNAVPARPLRLFEAMWEHLRPAGLMRLLLAEHEGRTIAGAIVLGLGATCFYAFGASLREGAPPGAAYALQWQLMHDACAAGYRRYDLGEVPEGHAGLEQFKRKWGAEQVTLHRYYHPASTAPDAAGYGDEGGRAAGLARRAWTRVPLPVTAAVGAAVYRFL